MPNQNKNKTVVIGMSGGVDSSVAALLLKQQGYNVVGLFMKNWDEKDENGECTSAADWQDALAVSGVLGIPCYSVSFADEYMDRVFAYFLDEYKKGRTPNPDVLCNREIKFGPFKEFAKKLGADYIATGHYCGIRRVDSDHMVHTPRLAAEGAVEGGPRACPGVDTGHYSNHNGINGAADIKAGCISNCGTNHLIKATDISKDQTYFLNQVTTNQLDNVIFPLASINKSEVRRLAAQYSLPTAKKKDSTGICFIGERKFKAFLSTYLPAQQGDIRDISGALVGTHSGLMYYTLGQRRGLGIGGVKDEKNSRWYVVDKDLSTNTLVVSCGEGEELLSNSLIASGFNWIGDIDWSSLNRIDKAFNLGTPQLAVTPAIGEGNIACLGLETDYLNGTGNYKNNSPNKLVESYVTLECNAKFRYRQDEQKVRVIFNKNNPASVLIEFENKQRAVTPGQYAVLYYGDRCLGGGVIEKVNKNLY